MKLRSVIFAIVLFSTLLGAPAAMAQDGLRGALSESAHSLHSVPALSPQIAAADFDHDRKSDGAILLETGRLNGRRSFRIELHLTAEANKAILFSSVEADLSISALDVNRDGATDIVVEKVFPRQRLQVYLNDGHGAFHRVRIEEYPSPDPFSPGWRTALTLDSLAIGLPASRGFDDGVLRPVSVLSRKLAEPINPWHEILLVQSGPRAPNSSRAPPSHLSL